MSESYQRIFFMVSNQPGHMVSRRWITGGIPLGRSIRKAVIGIIRTLKFSRTVCRLVICLALMKGYAFLFYTTLAPIFTPGYIYATQWHLTPEKSGLTFLAMYIGTFVGSLIGFGWLQWARVWIEEKIGRRLRSTRQYQQLPLLLGNLIICGAVLGFEWSVVRAKELIVLLVAPLGASIGISLTTLTIEAVLSDFFARESADAIATSNFLGSLTGGLLPPIGQLLYRTPLGIKWTYGIFGTIFLILALSIVERLWLQQKEGSHHDQDPSDQIPSDQDPSGSLEMSGSHFDGLTLSSHRPWTEGYELRDML